MGYIKIPFATASQVTARYQPSPQALALLSEALVPEEFVATLEQNALYGDVITFLAHGLPPREGVAWGVQCCREVEADNNSREQAALAAARAWYLKPDETNRRFAEQAAQATELQTAAGWIAQAVFWSAGSVTPADAPVVPPPPWLYCHAVAGAVNLAAVLPDGSQANRLYPLFIQYGLAIAQGRMPQTP